MAVASSLLSPRERVRRFLAGETVDRIPNGWGGCETAGLHSLAYERLKRVVGVDGPSNRLCTFMTNAVFDLDVLEAIEGDLVLLGTRMCPVRLWGPDAAEGWQDLALWDTVIQVPKPWRFRRDPDGTVWWDDVLKCPPGGYLFDPVPPPPDTRMWGTAPLTSPRDYHPPMELPEDYLRRLEEDARLLWETTDYSIVCGESIYDLQRPYDGPERWWMRMMEEPEVCEEILTKACDASIAQLRQLDQAVGKYCSLLMIAHDMGDATGVTTGPDLWREIYKPHYKRLFTEWHRITKMKVALHTCGSVHDILGDLIDCGVDVYNPVQQSAARMDPATLKAEFGDRIVLYGGAYDAVLTPTDTPEEEVYEVVRNNIQILSRGGGYVFAGVHNLPAETPEAHLRAILQAYRDCRDDACLRNR